MSTILRAGSLKLSPSFRVQGMKYARDRCAGLLVIDCWFFGQLFIGLFLQSGNAGYEPHG